MSNGKRTTNLVEDERLFSRVLLSSLSDLLSGPRVVYYLIGLFALLVLIGAMFAVNAMYIGYMHTYGISREFPWGLLISGYIFFAVTSTGIGIISSIGHVFGIKSFMPIAKRAVYISMIAILTGFMVIFFDLENPFRLAIWNPLSPNPTSNIWWMGTFYSIYLVFLTLEFIFILIEKHKYSKLAGAICLITGIAAYSNLGAVFGMLCGREFWYGPYLPIFFVTSAATSGCMAIIFFTYLGYKINAEKMDKTMEIALSSVGKIWALFLAILVFFYTWRIITGLAGSEGNSLVIKEMLFGKYMINFWFFEVILGLAAPLFLLFISRFSNINQIFVASLLAFIGSFFRWFDIVVLGQILSHYSAYNVTDYPKLFSYTPSIYEIMIVVGALSFLLLAFLIGERLFKGHKIQIH